MARRLGLLLLAIGLLAMTSCQRARQFPAAAPAAKQDEEKKHDELSYRLSWIEPSLGRDLPIVFVADNNAEWSRLPAFWTHDPAIPLYLAQPPLPALASFVAQDALQAIKIKVPRGLPDPTPNIPPANPPTYGKWRLGRNLFHLKKLRAGGEVLSCATCHNARQGFTDDRAQSPGSKLNTLSLINVAYNRRQFWDGRVRTLEETLVRALEDERKRDEAHSNALALAEHRWGGFVRGLVKARDAQLNLQFQLVFGISEPTQDAVAQALATYMRTILSGDSLFDRAEKIRRDREAPALQAEHFRESLKDDLTAALLTEGLTEKPKRDALPDLVMHGHALFHGKARCSRCHTGALFTDHDFHNNGYLRAFGEERVEGDPPPGVETGRALRVPIGLKESRLIGAFRTPTLRNLGRTRPYLHNGSLVTLARIVDFYDNNVQFTPHLAKQLKEGDLPMRLQMSQAEKDALVVFLRTLEGTPVDPVVAGPTN